MAAASVADDADDGEGKGGAAPSRRRHRCRRFVGVEISGERAAEARANVLRAREAKEIPVHVSVEIICANALDETAVDYARATVLFLYLVPRGLRLIKPLVWPEVACGGGRRRKDSNDGKDISEMTIQQSQQQRSSLSHEREMAGTATMTAAATVTVTTTTAKPKRPRRIVTYMAPFEGTPHVRKELCKVEHQEGAAWPVYLYHVDA